TPLAQNEHGSLIPPGRSAEPSCPRYSPQIPPPPAPAYALRTASRDTKEVARRAATAPAFQPARLCKRSRRPARQTGPPFAEGAHPAPHAQLPPPWPAGLPARAWAGTIALSLHTAPSPAPKRDPLECSP